MPTPSWNEIRQNAIRFAADWKDESSERAEAQTFWNELFGVFGIRRRTVASFEAPVRSIRNTHGRIDLFWKGRLLAEHKSAGELLNQAESQAFQYIQNLASSGRNDEIPRYVVLSDFSRFVLFDLEPDDGSNTTKRIEFLLSDLHKNVKHFAFFIGQKVHRFEEEDPANLKAAQLMADLHDAIAVARYDAEFLERLLVRLLFCLFADDTGIFEAAQFELFVENKTRADGSDLGSQLNALFEVLNTPVPNRSSLLDEDLAAFPYINGDLFKDRLPFASFDRNLKDRLLKTCRFDWSYISPAIFGALFQGIMDPIERRKIGAHYTAEKNILKVIQPLFLDALSYEFESIVADRSTRRVSRLREFCKKLGKLRFLDPACGCGNFLVITYRELRRLEFRALREIYDFENRSEQLPFGELAKLSQVDVDQFFGIEIGEWPARIAETALWLMDHQMNTELSVASGNVFQRIPLRASPHILCENALCVEWHKLLRPEKCSYLLGNPPYVGKSNQSVRQKQDLSNVASTFRGAGTLDYVAGWYIKAAAYIKATDIECAYVSTNSITQGEQVSVLWRPLFEAGIHINFAHRTFAWQSEARGRAHVHVVIIGFGLEERKEKVIFDYEDYQGGAQRTEVAEINAYLFSGHQTFVEKSRSPRIGISPMLYGSKPVDGGFLIMTGDEKDRMLSREPALAKYVREYVGTTEFLTSKPRYCLWLVDCPPQILRNSPELRERVAAVRKYRLQSNKSRTRADANRPAEFSEIRQPMTRFIAVPEISSEKRRYIPIGYLEAEVIASNKIYQIPDASVFEFGVIQSAMHTAWAFQFSGRLESRIQYSSQLAYNTFPWPSSISDGQRKRIESCANTVLTTRARYLDAGATLADLYDPTAMPADLRQGHESMDRAVDLCYRRKRFGSERERVEFLFLLYERARGVLDLAAGA